MIPRRIPKSPLSGYAVAVLATAAVAALRMGLHDQLGEKLQFTPFTLAVVAAAAWGGLGPGLAATVLGALAEMYAVVPTEFNLSRAGLPDWADAAMFVLIGGAISWLCESIHAGRRRVERERRRLEQNVEKRLAAERALEASEAAARERLIELQSVYAATPIGMLQLDAELRCVRASDRAAEIYGATGLAYEGRAMREIIPSVADRLEPAARSVLESGEPIVDLVLTVPGPGDAGSRGWVQSIYPIRDEQGGTCGVSIVSQEVTQRMRAEREARESETRFRALVDAVSSIVWVADARGSFRAPQESWSRYTGQDGPAQSGLGWTEAIHPEDRARFLELWEKAVASGTVLVESARLWHAESRAWRRCDATGVPVPGADGRVREWICKFLDVEARVRAEDELAMVSEQLRIVTESMAAPVTRCTRDMRYRWVSRPYAEWLRREPEEIVGRAIEDVIGAEAMQALRPRFERVLAGHVVRYEEEVDFRKIGRRWIRAVYTPTLDASGAVDGWVAVVVDIHALKKAEAELREADARKERFLATLAHELRNPLAPLRNSLEILKRPNVTEEIARQAREAMERQLSHAVRLVDDLLDVSRINRDTLELRFEKCDVAAVVAQAVEAVRPHLDAGAHPFELELPDPPLALRADPIRLAQVLANLLHNASKFSDRGAPITLSAAKEAGWVTLTVRDSGIGFPPEMAESIFEMFVQLEPGPSRAAGGLGVGLSLVRRLTEMHGGRVEAVSAGPGRGSEFRVVLPEFANASDSPSAFLRLPPRARPGASRRILVVDDNPDSAASLSTLLALSGNETRVAHDGVEAVSETEAFHPDVVLLDIGMPRMDGYEAARRIRELPNGRGVLLVAVSGWGQQEDRRRSREAGFDHHMVKPLRAAALETLLAGAPAPVSAGSRQPRLR